jgi:multidrug resistance efflux pump
MAEKKTSAQLRQELAEVEWNEYLCALKAKQEERIKILADKVTLKTAELEDARAKLAAINARIKSGVVGIVPKPLSGGVVVAPLPGNLAAKGA